MSFPQQYKIVQCYSGAANAVDCDIVSLKNILKGWFVVHHKGNTDVDLTLSLYQATAVAGTGGKAVTVPCPTWLDADQGTSSDVLVRQSDAYTITIDPATQNGVLWVIEVDPAILDTANGYDCVYLADTGGSSSNTCAIWFIGKVRDASDSLPAIITD